jgi:hypothetical protein
MTPVWPGSLGAHGGSLPLSFPLPMLIRQLQRPSILFLPVRHVNRVLSQDGTP